MEYCSYQITIFSNLPPLVSAAWCGPHPPHHPRYASVYAIVILISSCFWCILEEEAVTFLQKMAKQLQLPYRICRVCLPSFYAVFHSTNLCCLILGGFSSPLTMSCNTFAAITSCSSRLDHSIAAGGWWKCTAWRTEGIFPAAFAADGIGWESWWWECTVRAECDLQLPCLHVDFFICNKWLRFNGI